MVFLQIRRMHADFNHKTRDGSILTKFFRSATHYLTYGNNMTVHIFTGLLVSIQIYFLNTDKFLCFSDYDISYYKNNRLS